MCMCEYVVKHCQGRIILVRSLEFVWTTVSTEMEAEHHLLLFMVELLLLCYIVVSFSPRASVMGCSLIYYGHKSAHGHFCDAMPAQAIGNGSCVCPL